MSENVLSRLARRVTRMFLTNPDKHPYVTPYNQSRLRPTPPPITIPEDYDIQYYDKAKPGPQCALAFTMRYTPEGRLVEILDHGAKRTPNYATHTPQPEWVPDWSNIVQKAKEKKRIPVLGRALKWKQVD